MDIQEELPSEELSETKNSADSHLPFVPPVKTIPQQSTVSSTDTSSHQLPSHISHLLDELELEEQQWQKTKTQSDSLASYEPKIEPSSPEFISSTHLDEQLIQTPNFSSTSPLASHSKDEDQELKNWGKTGLDGLKNIFKPSSQLPPATSSHENQPSLPAETPIKVTHEIPLEASSNTALPPKSKTKKTVAFAPETYLPSSKSKPEASSEPPDRPQPSPGIMLSDIVEHPLPEPTPNGPISTPLTVPAGVNGRNAHLNPRLASLLPQSLKKKPSLERDRTGSIKTDSLADQDQFELTGQENGLASDEDSDDDGHSSAWSDKDEEAEGSDEANWPPEDLDIQTALDLRQAALEYHTRRQGLGIGKGTGPLGGEGPPCTEDDEREWVPIHTRAQAPGVPRETNGKSRFKTGRTLPHLDPNHLSNYSNDDRVIDGKLFGTEPIIPGPSPTIKGAAFNHIPGRKADFSELDDELTAEEVELLRSRLEALGMDEERRLAAERAGSELMDWMEKARRGELDELLDDQDMDHHIQQISSATSPIPSQSFSSNEKDEQFLRPVKCEGPPEIKTAPKSHLLPLNSRLTHTNKSQPGTHSHSSPSCDLIKSNSNSISSRNSIKGDVNHEFGVSEKSKNEHLHKDPMNNPHLSPSPNQVLSATVIETTNDPNTNIITPGTNTKKMSRFKSSVLTQSYS